MKPFTAPMPRLLSWVWIGVVALLLVDLAVRGRDSSSLVAAAVLLITVGGVYVLWLRPKVAPSEEGVRVVNPLRETFIPWSAFTWTDVTDVLRVHAGDTVVRSWALRETRRAKVRENLRRAGGLVDGDPVGDGDPRTMRPVELHALRLRELAERQKARQSDGGGQRPVGPVWSPDAVGALAGPVALLLVILMLF